MPRFLTLVAWAWLPYLLVEFTATHWPGPKGAPPFDDGPWDKLQHFGAFFLAGVLVALALRLQGRSRAIWIVAAVGLAAYSLLDEATQPLFRRDSEWLDWAADLSGIALGMTLVAWWPRHGPPGESHA